MMPQLTPREIARFQSKLVLTGCGLRWSGPVNNHGYGRFEFYRDGKRQRVLAHRLAYYLWTGIDPGESKMRHGCDTPPCCTPDCLEPGTQADNIHDAVERGRMNYAGLLLLRQLRRAAALQRVDVGTKRCSNCGAVKPLSAFARHAGNADGRQYWCTGCRSAAQRKKRGAG